MEIKKLSKGKRYHIYYRNERHKKWQYISSVGVDDGWDAMKITTKRIDWK